MFKLIGTVCCLLALCAVGCHKYDRLSDLQESKDTCRILGRIFLLDSLTQQGLYVPQPKKQILLRDAATTDTVNYLFSATTDDNGYFVFKNLTSGKHYRLVFEETNATGVLVRADTTVVAPAAGVKITASPSLNRQTGIYYTIIDTAGQALPGATFCLFSNQAAYQSGKCDNSNYNLTSDHYGRVFQTGLLPGQYYVLVSVAVGGTKYTARDTIELTGSVIQKRLTILPPELSQGVRYTVLDPSGYMASHAQVCLFLNPQFSQDGGCQGSIVSDSTSSSGQVSFSGLMAGIYYTNIRLQVNANMYTAKDTLMITAATITSRTIQLH